MRYILAASAAPHEMTSRAQRFRIQFLTHSLEAELSGLDSRDVPTGTAANDSNIILGGRRHESHHDISGALQDEEKGQQASARISERRVSCSCKCMQLKCSTAHNVTGRHARRRHVHGRRLARATPRNPIVFAAPLKMHTAPRLRDERTAHSRACRSGSEHGRITRVAPSLGRLRKRADSMSALRLVIELFLGLEGFTP